MTAARPASLSLRLAVVYGLLLAATLLVVAGLTAAIARSHLERGLDAQLRAVAESFQRGPASRATGPAGLRREARRWLAEQPLPEHEMVALRIVGGPVLTSAGGLDLFEVPNPGPLLAAKEARWWKLHGTDGGVRGLTVPVVSHGSQLGTLVLLAYEQRIDTTLAALLSGIGWASGIGLALAVVLGTLIVRRSLRPLRTMAAGVAAIEATGDLSRRVRAGGPPDEVGRLGAAFDRMLARLEESFRAQRRFLADASHELRTPLAVARGRLELLADELGPDERRSLASATEELDRMARLVDDLLLLARLDEGMELRREPVELELVLREALLRAMLLSPRAVHVEAEPGIYALADPDRLLQVLTNLTTNAVQHSDGPEPVVLAAARHNGSVAIEVSDGGHGIAPDDLPHVFERLYRGRRARAARPEGAGLGLAIAASLVAAMDGTISVRSGDRAGTTFAVSLPSAEPAGGNGHTAGEEPPTLPHLPR